MIGGLARILALVLAFAGVARAEPLCDVNVVQLRGPWGQAQFRVELADEPTARARGLMHRESLPLSQGMLFVYEHPQRVSFWMRNTLIPLDMLFIDARGRVRRIHHQAIPRDETQIPGGPDILAVLEINGGLAARMGMTEGSEIRHPAFGFDALWPCPET